MSNTKTPSLEDKEHLDEGTIGSGLAPLTGILF